TNGNIPISNSGIHGTDEGENGAVDGEVNSELEEGIRGRTDVTDELSTSHNKIALTLSGYFSSGQTPDVEVHTIQQNATEPDTIVTDSDSSSETKSTPLPFHALKSQIIISNVKPTRASRNKNQTSSKRHSHKEDINENLKDLFLKIEKYVATADNSDLLWSSISEDKQIMDWAKITKYLREYAITKFQNNNEFCLITIKKLQSHYEKILKDINESSKWVESEREGKIFKIILNKKKSKWKQKMLQINENKTSIFQLIFYNLNKILMNLSPPRTSTTQTEARSSDFEVSIEKLEDFLNQEIRNLENLNTEISDFSKICSSFVHYERTIFLNKDKNEIVNSFPILKIEETLSKLETCMKQNIVYEILAFIYLHKAEPLKSIKKYHVISTYFILKALYIHLDKLKYRDYYTHSTSPKAPNSRYMMGAKIFYIGQLFEKLLRNLENSESKADSYGILNCLRFLLTVTRIGGNNSGLLKLQITTLIAMVIDESFSFDKNKSIEFAAFALQIMDITNNKNRYFLNNKFEYFLEQNLSFFKNIKADERLYCVKDIKIVQSKADICNDLIGKFRQILDQSLENETNASRSLRFKEIYIWQLYWIVIHSNRAQVFYMDIAKRKRKVEKLFETINFYY
ncbi:hypothetical protein CWI39_0980p0010, partial [Hamiltosporidium magnivora]